MSRSAARSFTLLRTPLWAVHLAQSKHMSLFVTIEIIWYVASSKLTVALNQQPLFKSILFYALAYNFELSHIDRSRRGADSLNEPQHNNIDSGCFEENPRRSQNKKRLTLQRIHKVP